MKKNYQLFLCEYVPTYRQIGDVNGDGYVSTIDGDILLEYVKNSANFTDDEKEIIEKFGDLNKDGEITIEDAELALQIADGTEDSTLSPEFLEHWEKNVRRVIEISSSSSSFSGKAFNIEFYSKIDGTHELTFELPWYYFDEDLGETVENFLINYLSNKCTIELYFPDTEKSHLLIINNHEQKEDRGIISCHYSASDAYIEELAKTGYGINFQDDVEGNGLGDIHELTQKVLKGTDWKYNQENTGVLKEYFTELEYDPVQLRYNTIQKSLPVHGIKYIPELKRYCYELNLFKKGLGKDRRKRFYVYEETEQNNSNSIQNLIYNGEDFSELSGWEVDLFSSNLAIPILGITKNVESGKEYFDLFVDGSANQTGDYARLINTAAAESNITIEGQTPYLFSFAKPERDDEGNKSSAGKIVKIEIYDKYPGLEDSTPVYSLSAEDIGPYSDGKTKSYFYNEKLYKYVIKTPQTIVNPYFVFTIQFSNDKKLFLRNISLFKMIPKSNENNELELLSSTFNGMYLSMKDDDGNEDLKLYETLATPEVVFSAYTEVRHRFFVRDQYYYLTSKNPDVAEEIREDTNKEDTVTYYDFYSLFEETEILGSPFLKGKIDLFHYSKNNKEWQNFVSVPLDKVESLPSEGDKDYKDCVYFNKEDNNYYQYYVTEDDLSKGEWNFPFLGDGDHDKRRTLVVEKSNRFNIIQTIAELFSVWPVFSISRDPSTGKVIKTIWYKEKAIKQNFSGFHKGVNLKSLSRTIDSNEVVTKMFVEDVDSDFSEDGFVTIRTCHLNPWGENFYYNFKYYVEQGLLSPKIEEEKEELYASVGQKNTKIYDLNQQIIEHNIQISNLEAQEKSLAFFISSARERISSLKGDRLNSQISKTDKNLITANIEELSRVRLKYEKELSSCKEKKNKLVEERDDWQEEVDRLQEEKEALIQKFELHYSLYIKEGTWQDTSYGDDTAYYLDSQKVSLTSAMPKTTWNISVLTGDTTEDLKNFAFEVGDQTILVDNDFFKIKEGDPPFKFEVLISGIKEKLDKLEDSVIEVRNYLTSFEDIFQRISATTQSVQLNEQIYNRSAFFTTDGQIDQSILQNTLSQNNFILANASDNSYQLDSGGLFLQSVLNPAKKLAALAEGIFLSNSTDQQTGEPQWKTGITADGISASLITSGELNTSLIRIFSNSQPSFTLGELGLSAFDTVGTENLKNRISCVFIGDSLVGRGAHLYKKEEGNDEYTYKYVAKTSPGWSNFFIASLSDEGYLGFNSTNRIKEEVVYYSRPKIDNDYLVYAYSEASPAWFRKSKEVDFEEISDYAETVRYRDYENYSDRYPFDFGVDGSSFEGIEEENGQVKSLAAQVDLYRKSLEDKALLYYNQQDAENNKNAISTTLGTSLFTGYSFYTFFSRREGDVIAWEANINKIYDSPFFSDIFNEEGVFEFSLSYKTSTSNENIELLPFRGKFSKVTESDYVLYINDFTNNIFESLLVSKIDNQYSLILKGNTEEPTAIALDTKRVYTNYESQNLDYLFVTTGGNDSINDFTKMEAVGKIALEEQKSLSEEEPVNKTFSGNSIDSLVENILYHIHISSTDTSFTNFSFYGAFKKENDNLVLSFSDDNLNNLEQGDFNDAGLIEFNRGDQSNPLLITLNKKLLDDSIALTEDCTLTITGDVTTLITPTDYPPEITISIEKYENPILNEGLDFSFSEEELLYRSEGSINDDKKYRPNGKTALIQCCLPGKMALSFSSDVNRLKNDLYYDGCSLGKFPEELSSEDNSESFTMVLSCVEQNKTIDRKAIMDGVNEFLTEVKRLTESSPSYNQRPYLLNEPQICLINAAWGNYYTDTFEKKVGGSIINQISNKNSYDYYFLFKGTPYTVAPNFSPTYPISPSPSPGPFALGEEFSPICNAVKKDLDDSGFSALFENELYLLKEANSGAERQRFLEDEVFPFYEELSSRYQWLYLNVSKEWSTLNEDGRTPCVLKKFETFQFKTSYSSPTYSTTSYELTDSGNFDIDGRHPTRGGSYLMSKSIRNKMEKFIPKIHISKEEQQAIREAGLVRFDKYGVYSVSKENTDYFGYMDNGTIPWYHNKNYADALKYIEKYSLFSLTSRGFNLNVKGRGFQNGRLILGEYEGNYGLYILNHKDKKLISFNNEGEAYISGWQITETALYKLKRNLLFGLQCPTRADTEEDAIAIGKIKKGKWGTAPFRVTTFGKLYATSGQIGNLIIGDKGVLQNTNDVIEQFEYNNIFYSIKGSVYARLYPGYYMARSNITMRNAKNQIIGKQNRLSTFYVGYLQSFYQSIFRAEARLGLRWDDNDPSCPTSLEIRTNDENESDKNYVIRAQGIEIPAIGENKRTGTLSIQYRDRKTGKLLSGLRLGISGNFQGSWAFPSSSSTTSDERLKNSIATIPIKYEKFFDKISPVIYKYNDGTSDRYHTGFIAQQIYTSLMEANIDTKDFAGFTIFDEGTEEEKWCLRYEEFVSLNTWQIQFLKKKVQDLETLVFELKQKLDEQT